MTKSFVKSYVSGTSHRRRWDVAGTSGDDEDLEFFSHQNPTSLGGRGPSWYDEEFRQKLRLWDVPRTSLGRRWDVVG